MQVETQYKNMTLIIGIYGEIDHHSTEEIREKIDKALQHRTCKNILFDFSHVTFMDSSGIGMVIGRYKHMKSLGGKTVLASADEKVAQIFKISGLMKILPAFANVKEALEYIEGGTSNEF